MGGKRTSPVSSWSALLHRRCAVAKEVAGDLKRIERNHDDDLLARNSCEIERWPQDMKPMVKTICQSVRRTVAAAVSHGVCGQQPVLVQVICRESCRRRRCGGAGSHGSWHATDAPTKARRRSRRFARAAFASFGSSARSHPAIPSAIAAIRVPGCATLGAQGGSLNQ